MEKLWTPEQRLEAISKVVESNKLPGEVTIDDTLHFISRLIKATPSELNNRHSLQELMELFKITH